MRDLVIVLVLLCAACAAQAPERERFVRAPDDTYAVGTCSGARVTGATLEHPYRAAWSGETRVRFALRRGHDDVCRLRAYVVRGDRAVAARDLRFVSFRGFTRVGDDACACEDGDFRVAMRPVTPAWY